MASGSFVRLFKSITVGLTATLSLVACNPYYSGAPGNDSSAEAAGFPEKRRPRSTPTPTATPSPTPVPTATPAPTPTPSPTPIAQTAITGFLLVKAGTNQTLRSLTNGATVNLAIDGTDLNIVATANAATESVAFDLNGARVRIENVAPFALGSDDGGIYRNAGLSVGAYTLKATPFSADNAAGGAGASATLGFTVVNQAPPAPTEKPGYVLTFSEEFTDATMSFPNAKWSTNFFGFGGLRTLPANGEKQIYVDKDYAGSCGQPLGLNPFAISGGYLTISANRTPENLKPCLNGYPYTSGLLTTPQFRQLYGYFEMRAKLPAGQGLWPAFWMVGYGDYGHEEVDIFEVLGHQPSTIYQTVYSPKSSCTYTGVNTSTGFHTYGLEWTATDIIMYVDGRETCRKANTHFNPKYFLLNLAVGGSWPGDPDATTVFPAQMIVDYVRAYRKQ